jgi:hypothetical protein
MNVYWKVPFLCDLFNDNVRKSDHIPSVRKIVYNGLERVWKK